MNDKSKINIELGYTELVDLSRFFRRGVADAKAQNIYAGCSETVDKKLVTAMQDMKLKKAKARLKK